MAIDQGLIFVGEMIDDDGRYAGEIPLHYCWTTIKENEINMDSLCKINLNFVSNKPLDDVISNEKLVIENCQCSKILGKEMTRCVRKKERYDRESDSWEEIAPMKIFRSWLALVPMDDNYVYALGGEASDDKIQKSVERYDIITGEWSNVSAMQESRHCHAASVVQGKIYTVGGACQSGVILCSLECYDPTNVPSKLRA
ncbi:unnamed protein product, partial [Clavelina lepadiformis]